jgi:transglutaminase-like putative cysteine protease
VHDDVTTFPTSRVSSPSGHWGTRVDTFGVRPPHDRLEVVAKATVETADRATDPPSLSMASFENTKFRDSHLEFLQTSPHVDWGNTVASAASGCVDGVDGDAVGVVMKGHECVSGLDSRTGATHVDVSVDDVLGAGAGVCQDFAHLAIAVYRHLGIPARYVSGYLFTIDDSTGADSDIDEVHVETHAWVEVALPGWGWLALDPTNAQAVGERHVTIGRGRDDDVSPFRGVFTGRQDHELDVSVTMRRLALEPLGDVPGGFSRQMVEQQQQ